MFDSPLKTNDTPVVYTASASKKNLLKERNKIFLVSGNKVKLQNETSFEKDVANFIKTKSKGWFGKEFTYEKIKKCLKTECLLDSKSKCIDAIYNREVTPEDLSKYSGSKISTVLSISSLQISGKEITLFCKIIILKMYKKDKIDSKYMIHEEEEQYITPGVSSESEESEVSDDEVDVEIGDEDFV